MHSLDEIKAEVGEEIAELIAQLAPTPDEGVAWFYTPGPDGKSPCEHYRNEGEERLNLDIHNYFWKNKT